MIKKLWPLWLLLFLVGLDWSIRAPDSRSRELTQAIASEGSAGLQAYPYKFHVLKIDGDTAVLSTPRNFDVPAFKALAALYPNLNTKDANNPEFIAAEQALGQVQSEARLIVLSQAGIRNVRWELDRDWLAAQHIDVPEAKAR
jgi:hypothetical protein